MFLPNTDATAFRARLGAVGWVDINHLDARRLGLVLHELLQLMPGPAMQARAHTLTGLDPLADVGQFFHRDKRSALFQRLLKPGGAFKRCFKACSTADDKARRRPLCSVPSSSKPANPRARYASNQRYRLEGLRPNSFPKALSSVTCSLLSQYNA